MSDMEKSFGQKVVGLERIEISGEFDTSSLPLPDDSMMEKILVSKILDLLDTRRSYPGTDERQEYLCDKAIEKMVEAHGWAVSALMYQQKG